MAKTVTTSQILKKRARKQQHGSWMRILKWSLWMVVLLMFMGAAIFASVWRKEAFGGRLLIADGVLILVSLAIVIGTRDSLPPLWLFAIAFLTMVLPPIIAGSLFLICHRRSIPSVEQVF